VAGSTKQGKKAAKTNRAKDPNYYRKLGAKGGKVTGKKGFALMSVEKRSAAGRKGGLISRRQTK
jgi:general stress protein YciG